MVNVKFHHREKIDFTNQQEVTSETSGLNTVKSLAD
jgi:hypothetical protein